MENNLTIEEFGRVAFALTLACEAHRDGCSLVKEEKYRKIGEKFCDQYEAKTKVIIEKLAKQAGVHAG